MYLQCILGLLMGWACLGNTLLWAAPPNFQLQTAPAREIEGTYTKTIRVPNYQVKEWKFFLADPPTLPCQTEVTTTVKPEATTIKEVGKRQRSVLFVKVTDPEARHEIQVQVTYRATLMSRRLVQVSPRQRRPPVPALKDEEREQALESTELIDHQAPEFQAWLASRKLRRLARETDLAFAHRVFCDIAENSSYDYSQGLDRRASAVCGELKSDCAGLSTLFVSVLRANGIPARNLVGRLARSVESGATLQGPSFHGQHVRAELFVAGIGWIPADVTRALKDKSPTKMKHFGNDSGDLLVFHLDSGLTIDISPKTQKTYHWLQSVPYFYYGQGSSEGRSSETTWEVKTLKGQPLGE